MKNFSLIFLVFFSISIYAQEKFIAFKNPSSNDKKKIINKLKVHFNLIEKGNSAKRYHKKQQNIILNLVKKNHFIIDESYEKYIQFLIHDLVKSNSNLFSQNSLILFSDQTEPNASYIGYGIMIVNLGLFLMTKNEIQIQSILAHELAHQIKNHVENRIETKDNHNILSEEFEADSIAIVLLNNANKNPTELISVLENAKKYPQDNIELNIKTLYKKFNIPNHPFNENWLYAKNYTTQNTNLKNKTKYLIEINHRIKKIQNSLNSNNTKIYKSDFLSSNNPELFKKLKQDAQYHQVSSLSFYKEYGLSLYQTLLLMQENPHKNKNFLEEYFLKNLEKLYEAKKYNEFHKFVHFPNITNKNQSYFRFLNLLWNLTEKEFKNILAYYSKNK